MSRHVTTTIGYGFRLPQSAINHIEETHDSVDDFLEELTAHEPALTHSMAYWGDHYEDRPYALMLDRLTETWNGVAVHEGPDQSYGTDLTNNEVSAFIRAINLMGIKPDFITLRWLIVVSIAD